MNQSWQCSSHRIPCIYLGIRSRPSPTRPCYAPFPHASCAHPSRGTIFAPHLFGEGTVANRVGRRDATVTVTTGPPYMSRADGIFTLRDEGFRIRRRWARKILHCRKLRSLSNNKLRRHHFFERHNFQCHDKLLYILARKQNIFFLKRVTLDGAGTVQQTINPACFRFVACRDYIAPTQEQGTRRAKGSVRSPMIALIRELHKRLSTYTGDYIVQLFILYPWRISSQLGTMIASSDQGS